MCFPQARSWGNPPSKAQLKMQDKNIISSYQMPTWPSKKAKEISRSQKNREETKNREANKLSLSLRICSLDNHSV